MPGTPWRTRRGLAVRPVVAFHDRYRPGCCVHSAERYDLIGRLLKRAGFLTEAPQLCCFGSDAGLRATVRSSQPIASLHLFLTRPTDFQRTGVIAEADQ